MRAHRRRRAAIDRRRLMWWRLIKFLNYAVLAMAASVVGVAWGTYASVTALLPRPEQISTLQPNEGSKIYSADGVLLAQVSERHREYVPIEQIPENLKLATVAVEDSRFYEHLGVDFRGIGRAAWENLRSGRVRQGGSTITQQLARSVYLNPRRTVARKLQEIALALQIERKFSKPEILELYLNEIYFGNGAYGVKTAANTCFGRPLSKLTLGECALLAGIPQRPGDYAPLATGSTSPEQRAASLERTRARRDLVVHKMLDQGYINLEQATQATEEPIRLRPVIKATETLSLAEQKAPYFTSWILRQLMARYGEDAVYRGGLIIKTTLNWQLQQAAEKVLREGVEAARRRRVSEGALVAIDPTTGGVLAMVGGTDYRHDQFNCATQSARQPGSAFKPFIYTAAIESGEFTPKSVIRDSPVSYPGSTGKRWAPHNADGRYRGRIQLSRALAWSVNVVAVKLADEVGIRRVVETARSMGLKRAKLEPYLSTALGSGGVTPLEMAIGFSVLANKGQRLDPTGIREITDTYGNLWQQQVPSPVQVVKPETADTMTEMLQGVINNGTAAGALRWFKTYMRRTYPSAAVASGKTGTTSDYKDAWFIGYTREPVPLTCAVWVGNRDNKPMAHMFGATISAPIWGRFMEKALPVLVAEGRATSGEQAGRASSERAEQQTYTVRLCAETGLRVRPECPRMVRKTYVRGEPPYPPKARCYLHRPPPEPARVGPEGTVTLTICADSGQIAGENCPRVLTRAFDADLAPTETCTLHQGVRVVPPTEGEGGGL